MYTLERPCHLVGAHNITPQLADSRRIGMAKAGADVVPPGENQGGFSSDNSTILGFSHMHDSGTGGVSYNWCFRESRCSKL